MSRFIVFEGIDGSGKSTLMAAFCQELTRLGIGFIQTREPGGTLLGDELRRIILQKDEKLSPSPRTELLLYEASRAQHVDKVIRPSLEQKKWVISDRFAASSVAFQAGGRSISIPDVEWLNNFATNGLKPDLTVLVDVPIQEAFNRMQKRADEKDRIESEKNDFHERVRQSFLEQARQEKGKWLVLSGLNKPDEIYQQLVKHLVGLGWLS